MIVSQPVLYADEWTAVEVADFARHALRQPGGIGRIGDLSVSSYTPKTNARIWLVADADGNVLSEEPSLYLAIHALANGEVR